MTLVASLGMLLTACKPLAYSGLTLPKWSADDSQLMYLAISYSPLTLASKSELRLWTESTRNVKWVLAVSGQIDSYSWASENGLVAYSMRVEEPGGTEVPSVRIVRVADSLEVARWDLKPEDPSGPVDVSWSPDEKWLAVAANSSDRRIRLIGRGDFGNVRYIDVAKPTSGVSWTEQSTTLGYVSSGVTYIADAGSLEVSGVPGPVNAIGPVMGPQFRPGASQIAVTAEHMLGPGDYTKRLVVTDMTATLSEILVERRGPIPKASWSFNGELIAFTAYDGLGCPESGTNESQRDSSPRSSLGISRVLGLSRGHGPTTCIVEGNAVRALIRDPDGYADDVAWAHRSDQIAYSGRPDRQSEKGIYITDPKSGTSRHVA